MIGQAPGTILQLMYIKKRLRFIAKTNSTFLEIGAGNGILSNLLLQMGFNGTGVDMNVSACENNKKLNSSFIKNKRYSVCNDDFMSMGNVKFDFVISCMVIEHIPDDLLKLFIDKCKQVLNPGGRIIYLVPSSMKYWGIEDEIAGHIKRYEYSTIETLGNTNNLAIEHVAGLTYPLSNWLFSLSNRIIKKKETDKLNLSLQDRTIYTGNRNILYKTKFPGIFNIVLNPVILYPLYVLQNMNLTNPNAMVIYCELANTNVS
jgi:SAM-dependent methyltransferase